MVYIKSRPYCHWLILLLDYLFKYNHSFAFFKNSVMLNQNMNGISEWDLLVWYSYAMCHYCFLAIYSIVVIFAFYGCTYQCFALLLLEPFALPP